MVILGVHLHFKASKIMRAVLQRIKAEWNWYSAHVAKGMAENGEVFKGKRAITAETVTQDWKAKWLVLL